MVKVNPDKRPKITIEYNVSAEAKIIVQFFVAMEAY